MAAPIGTGDQNVGCSMTEKDRGPSQVQAAVPQMELAPAQRPSTSLCSRRVSVGVGVLLAVLIAAGILGVIYLPGNN